MDFNKHQDLHVMIDLERERLTLGGLLTILVEASIICENSNRTNIVLSIQGKLQGQPLTPEKIENIAKGLSIPTNVVYNSPLTVDWPIQSETESDFSYFSLQRVKELYARNQIKPVLCWNSELTTSVAKALAQLPNSVIGIHLKQQHITNSEIGNADIPVWIEAINRVSSNWKISFLLLGEDIITEDILATTNLISANSLNLSLVEQLAAIQLMSGIIGTASGFMSGAIFSTVPYVIYKHEHHDVAEMNREIGVRNSFDFASFNQLFLRKMPTVLELENALNRLISL